MQDYFSKYDLSLERIKENMRRMEQSMKWVIFLFDGSFKDSDIFNISQVIDCEDHIWNELDCVQRDTV